jgi:hypothetical protein
MTIDTGVQAILKLLVLLMGGIFEVDLEMGSCAVIYIPSSAVIGLGVQDS